MRCREAQAVEGKLVTLQGSLDYNNRMPLIGDSIGGAAEDLFKLDYKVKLG